VFSVLELFGPQRTQREKVAQTCFLRVSRVSEGAPKPRTYKAGPRYHTESCSPRARKANDHVQT
jgi:hypothetical protein